MLSPSSADPSFMTHAWIAFLVGWAALPAFGETIEFTDRELQAAYTLAHPESSSVRIDGREGVLTPAPALRYFGVPVQRFDVDLKLIADVLDLRFDGLEARDPQVEFDRGRLRLKVPVVDNSRAIRSSLGSIGFKRVVLAAELVWKTNADGSQRLGVGGVKFEGQLAGTGVLSGSLVLNQVKKLGIQAVSRQLERILERGEIQEKIQTGLVGWSRISTGSELERIVPGTLAFFREGATSGLRYTAE